MFRQRLLLFFALVVFSVLLMTLQVRTGPLNPLGFVSYPLNAMNNLISNSLFWIKQPVRVLLASSKENKRLTKEINELKAELRRYKEMEAEYNRVMNLLGIVEEQPLSITAARIISRSPDQSIKAFVLDKGSANGVEKDMIVITPDGLAGKIYRVWPDYSEVLLVTDQSFSVSVRLQEQRSEGIMTGTGRGCRLNYISNDIDVQEGQVLVTSGLDRFFPKGIPVGRIKSVTKTTPELFQDIVVTALVDISRVEEVVIIKR